MIEKIKKNEFERIIYIGGIWNLPYKSEKWKEVLEKRFPDKEIIFFTDIFYWTWEIKKIESIINDIVKTLTTDKKNTIIIAHSFGGIIARTVLSRLSDKDKNLIKFFLTMASPHKIFYYPPLNKTRKKLNTPLTEPDVNFFTLGGYLDHTVPFPTTHFDKKHSLNFLATHMSFFSNKKLIKKIVNLFIEK